MSQNDSTTTAPGAGFSWHPQYAGQSFDDVERRLASDISRDQRQYQLALEGAEQSEHESLTSIMELERNWGQYAFDWAEMEPDDLARRIVTFEQERERRKELISFADYRAAGGLVGGDAAGGRDSFRFSPLILGIAAAAVILVIVIVVLVF